MHAINVKNLKKYYGETKAVDDISFTVEKGEILGFLGPNGAGKTTTIRCLMDFIRPDSGTIEINGLDSHSDATDIKKSVGFLPGEVNLYENWTGLDHLRLVRDMRKQDTRARELIRTFEYDPTKKISQLSSGNKQKIGLILAMMNEPDLLILDEPTNALDPFLQHAVYEIIRNEAAQGRTIFMSSHNLSEVERICNRICIIRNGKIMAIEDLRQLKRKHLYTITVYFDQEIPYQELNSADIEIIRDFPDGLVLSVKGDVQPFLAKLGEFKLKDLEISHASLEDMFMEYYK
jgi:ABC-2 type transport system ATP-binding protein